MTWQSGPLVTPATSAPETPASNLVSPPSVFNSFPSPADTPVYLGLYRGAETRPISGLYDGTSHRSKSLRVLSATEVLGVFIDVSFLR